MCKMKCQVHLIGIGMGNEQILTKEAAEKINTAGACIGAERFRPLCPEETPYYSEYRAQEILKIIESHAEIGNWVILLSGDVGFYSGAKGLLAKFSEAGVAASCMPGIASVVYLAAKLGISWEDAALRSIHGRNQNIIYAIDHHAKTFLLLDQKSGEAFCERLKRYGFEDLTCYVGTRLSYEDERIQKIPAADLTPESFGSLATVLIENPHPNKSASPHIPDEAFIRSQRKEAAGDSQAASVRTVPMTKAEVRAVSMAKLALTRDAVFYDIGAGTGSVSVEAALHGEQIQVYAIEQRADACELIVANRQKFRADQIHIVEGTAPEAMQDLPVPTHAFIGGSTGHLHEIIRCLKEKNPKVTLVINAIALETVEELMRAVREGLLEDPEILQIQVAGSRKLGRYHMMTGQNPVYIITERHV